MFVPFFFWGGVLKQFQVKSTVLVILFFNYIMICPCFMFFGVQ